MLLAFGIAACALAGCGRSNNRPSLGRVRGTVSFQGKPLPTGSLTFTVVGTRQAQGKIVDGKIVLAGTFADDDGVPVGMAHIAVFAREPLKTSSPQRPARKLANPREAMAVDRNRRSGGKSFIPEKYNDPTTSGLTWNIMAGENEIVLDLR